MVLCFKFRIPLIHSWYVGKLTSVHEPCILQPCDNRLLVPGGFSVSILLDFPHRRSCHLNKDSRIPSFPMYTPFISLSCLIALAGTSSMMLERCGARGQPQLVPRLSGEASDF